MRQGWCPAHRAVSWVALVMQGSATLGNDALFRFGSIRYRGRWGDGEEDANADEGGWLSFTSVMTVAGMAVVVLLGSLFTAQSVVAGDVPATFVRFVLSITGGVYYLYLFHISRGRRIFGL